MSSQLKGYCHEGFTLCLSMDLALLDIADGSAIKWLKLRQPHGHIPQPREWQQKEASEQIWPSE